MTLRGSTPRLPNGRDHCLERLLPRRSYSSIRRLEALHLDPGARSGREDARLRPARVLSRSLASHFPATSHRPGVQEPSSRERPLGPHRGARRQYRIVPDFTTAPSSSPPRLSGHAGDQTASFLRESTNGAPNGIALATGDSSRKTISAGSPPGWPDRRRAKAVSPPTKKELLLRSRLDGAACA
jgi:hypothetical protein